MKDCRNHKRKTNCSLIKQQKSQVPVYKYTVFVLNYSRKMQVWSESQVFDFMKISKPWLDFPPSQWIWNPRADASVPGVGRAAVFRNLSSASPMFFKNKPHSAAPGASTCHPLSCTRWDLISATTEEQRLLCDLTQRYTWEQLSSCLSAAGSLSEQS